MPMNKVIPSVEDSITIKGGFKSAYAADSITNVDNDQTFNNFDEEEGSYQSPFLSIKCLLIFIIMCLLISTVLLLTTIWVSAYSTNVTQMGNSLLKEQIEKSIAFTDETIKKVLTVSQTTKNIMWKDFDYSDIDNVYSLTYRIYKSSYEFLSTLLVTVYFGDTIGGNIGVLVMGGEPTQMYINETGQYYWYCRDIFNNENCNMTSPTEPDIVLGPFDMSKIMGVAHKSPNKPGYSLSFTDPTLPSITFMSCVNSHPAKNTTLNNGEVYDWYFGIDISVSSISKYLENVAKHVSGSVSFAIEVETNYIVVSSFPDIPVSVWDDKGAETRMTPLTFKQGDVNMIGKFIYTEYNNNLKSQECGTYKYYSLDTVFVSTHRFCRAGVDWFFVFSEPKMNYIGDMIIAIIVGLSASLLIIIIGVVLGVISSIRIVKPLNNLIEQFSSVSDMNLENVNVSPSSFKEISLLQHHFLSMVAKVKHYRSFIPSYLIDQLDKGQKGTAITNTPHSSKYMKKVTDSVDAKSSFSSIFESLRKKSSRSSKGVPKSLFSLGIEKKTVSFSLIYFEGLNRYITNESIIDEVVSMIGDLMQIVQKTTKTSNGFVSNFENNSIIVSWNSTSDVRNHEEVCLVATSQILARLNSAIDNKWKNKGYSMSFRSATITQDVFCGNLGTDDFKNFAFVGCHVHNLHVMLKHATKLNIPSIVSNEVFDKTKNVYCYRFVGIKKLLNHQETDSYMQSVLQQDHILFRPTNLYQLGEASADNSDEEWMYSLNKENVKNERWKHHIEGVNALLLGNYQEAIEHFNNHLHYHSDTNYGEVDKVTAYLLEKCLELSKQQ